MIPLHRIPKEIEEDKRETSFIDELNTYGWITYRTEPNEFIFRNDTTYNVTFTADYNSVEWDNLRYSFDALGNTIREATVQLGTLDV